jgi:hypothetical protein
MQHIFVNFAVVRMADSVLWLQTYRPLSAGLGTPPDEWKSWLSPLEGNKVSTAKIRQAGAIA